MSNTGEKMKKYRINELLNELPVKDNKKAIAILPAQLGISPASFNNYRNICIGDQQDIPHTIVAMLEQFFSIAPGKLQNYRTDIRPLKDMDTNQLELDIANKFQFKKPNLIPHEQ